MQAPIFEEDFRYAQEPLEAGGYRIFQLDKHNRRHRAADGYRWKISIEEDGDNSGFSNAKRELDRLEQKIDQLLTEGSQTDDVTDAKLVEDQMQLKMQKALLQDEEFMARYGDKIGLAMFDIDQTIDDAELDFESWSESPLTATTYQIFNEPEKLEQAGSAFGCALDRSCLGWKTDL